MSWSSRQSGNLGGGGGGRSDGRADGRGADRYEHCKRSVQVTRPGCCMLLWLSYNSWSLNRLNSWLFWVMWWCTCECEAIYAQHIDIPVFLPSSHTVPPTVSRSRDQDSHFRNICLLGFYYKNVLVMSFHAVSSIPSRVDGDYCLRRLHVCVCSPTPVPCLSWQARLATTHSKMFGTPSPRAPPLQRGCCLDFGSNLPFPHRSARGLDSRMTMREEYPSWIEFDFESAAGLLSFVSVRISFCVCPSCPQACIKKMGKNVGN